MGNILIVNDSKFESMILSDMLNQLGYSVYITDEYNAMAHIHSLLPQVVIVNFIMKETQGDLLINTLKEEMRQVIYILSSNIKLDINEKYLKNVDAVIKTPVNKENLVDVINKLLQKKDIEIDTNEKSSIKELCRVDKRQRNLIKEKSDKKINNIESNIKKFCSYCGHGLENKLEGCSFCPFCGSKL